MVLKDDIETDGPHLDEIIQQWKVMTAKKLEEDSSECVNRTFGLFCVLE